MKTTSNDDVRGLLADADLVKAMIGNLACIDHAAAKKILDALADRASDPERPLNVPPQAVRKALDGLPGLPDTEPSSSDLGGYKYRSGRDGSGSRIEASWEIIDSAVKAKLASWQ